MQPLTDVTTCSYFGNEEDVQSNEDYFTFCNLDDLRPPLKIPTDHQVNGLHIEVICKNLGHLSPQFHSRGFGDFDMRGVVNQLVCRWCSSQELDIRCIFRDCMLSINGKSIDGRDYNLTHTVQRNEWLLLGENGSKKRYEFLRITVGGGTSRTSKHYYSSASNTSIQFGRSKSESFKHLILVIICYVLGRLPYIGSFVIQYPQLALAMNLNSEMRTLKNELPLTKIRLNTYSG